MNILIIEDDKDLCHAVSWQLQQEGHRTDCCHDGGEAVLYIRQGIYDLILLDCTFCEACALPEISPPLSSSPPSAK